MNQQCLRLSVKMEDFSFGTIYSIQGLREEKYVRPYLHYPIEKQNQDDS